MFFDTWSGLARVVIVGPLAYLALILFLRTSGKRTLTKLNAFDLVVTVALGSTLSSIILSKSVALLEGVLALATLIALQYLITWSSVRSSLIEGLVKAEPTLLAHEGELLAGAMRRQRVTRDDVLSALRSEGWTTFAGRSRRARDGWFDQRAHVVVRPAGGVTGVPQPETKPRQPGRA